MGDYYQFSVSTAGFADLALSWDQTSSNTGPKDFELSYSTDGTSFTNLTGYSVLANGGVVASAGTDRVDNVTVSGVASVPLPAAVWLLGSGLLGLFGLNRRR